MKVSTDVMQVLDRCRVEGNKLYLPSEQLHRILYMAVDKVLKAAGGKWERKEKAHVFPKNVEDVIDNIMLTGEISTKKENDFFPTPPEIVQQMIELAEIHTGMDILEPSAGDGAIIRGLQDAGITESCSVILVEKNSDLCDHLWENYGPRHTVVNLDFLEMIKLPEDIQPLVVLMNPPFSKQQDIDHVRHAFEMLAPKGRLVSVMSTGFTFRENKKSVAFREFVKKYGEIIPLPEGSFKKSGTMINTVIVVLDKY